MIEILFKTIPKYLFEPYAIIAAIGFFLFLFAWKIKRNYLFWIIAGSVFFMILWRVAILIVSARYAAALIYPAIIFSVYCCFKIDLLLNLFPKILQKVIRILPYVLVAALTIASCIKTFRINPYRNYFLEAYETVKKDAEKYPQKILLCDEMVQAKRAQYYTGINTTFSDELDFPKHNLDIPTLKNILRTYSFTAPVIYLFLDLRSKSPQIKPEDLGMSQEEWQFISAKYQNRHKKRQLFVYRYTPRKKIDVQTHKLQIIPQNTKKNLLKNGDFEQYYPEDAQELKEIRKFFRDMNLASPFSENSLFPAFWNPAWCPAYLPGHNGEIKLIDHHPIDGKYSLSVKSSSLIGFCYNVIQQANNTSYRLKYLVKTKKNTVFYWAAHLYDKKGAYQGIQNFTYFKLEPEQLYSIEMTIPSEALPPYGTFLLIFQLERGELLLDNVSLEKIEAAK